MENDIMTIEEVSELLKLKLKTAYNVAGKGGLPGFKVGGQWRFRRSELEKWIKQQEQKKRDKA